MVLVSINALRPFLGWENVQWSALNNLNFIRNLRLKLELLNFRIFLNLEYIMLLTTGTL